jgi:hypothetical protein
MIATIVWAVMATVVGYFAMVPLKAAAEYRFRNKLGLTLEGLAFLGCIVGAFFTGGLTSFLLLGGGIVAGAGIRSVKGNEQRYLE